jgi:hypothetical protein
MTAIFDERLTRDDQGVPENPCLGAAATNQRRPCGTWGLLWCCQATAGRKPLAATKLGAVAAPYFWGPDPPVAPRSFREFANPRAKPSARMSFSTFSRWSQVLLLLQGTELLQYVCA